jgi:hypothetical protein
MWVGRYELWSEDMRAALVRAPVALASSANRNLVLEVSGEALATLRGCAGFADELADPPKGFRAASALLERACAAFGRGADLMRAGDAHAAADAWGDAAELVQEANGRLPEPVVVEQLPLPAVAGSTTQSRVELFFSSVATRIAAPKAEVRCWDEQDWSRVQRETFGKRLDLAGFASFDYDRVNLAPDVCDGLVALSYAGERPIGDDQLAAAFAVVVLMHETGHLNEEGEFYGAGAKEPLAECWAMQHVREAAVSLGVDARYADELAERYWLDAYPTVQARYRSRKCRDGGEFDFRPGSSVWP